MARSLEILSRWHKSVDNLSTSTLGFYDSIEKAVRAKELPISATRTTRLEHGILSGTRQYLELSYDRYVYVLSALPFGKDFYFGWHLGRKMPNLAALGCGIVMGVPVLLLISVTIAGVVKGAFLFVFLLAGGLFAIGTGAAGNVSEIQEALCALPLIGPVYRRLFNPDTFYTEESRVMFEESVHRVVLDVVAGILTINKMTPLTEPQKEVQRRPQL